jgi:glycosyltransferase involved in cell wall biosynthesis
MIIADVAVVIPVYNGANTIIRAIDSVLRQSVKVKEIWIIDDCSYDNTLEVICDYLEGLTIDLPRIEILTSTENSGPGLSRNKAWDLSGTEYIAFLDADDSWAHDKIELQLRAMRNEPDCQITCHASFFPNKISVTSSQEVKLKRIIFRNTVYTRTVMLKRDIPLRFNVGLSEDFDLWIRCLQADFRIRFLSGPLAYHFKQDFSKPGISGQLLKHEYWEIRRLLDAIKRDPTLVVTGVVAISFSIIKFFRRVSIRLFRTVKT